MKTTPGNEGRAGLLAVVLLVTVFLTGGLVGAVLSGTAWAEEPMAPDTDGVPVGLAGLGLTQEQEDAMEAIMARHQPAVDSVVVASMRSIDSLVRTVDSEVRAVLTADQLAVYNEMITSQPRIRAVKRTMDSSGRVVEDTIR